MSLGLDYSSSKWSVGHAASPSPSADCDRFEFVRFSNCIQQQTPGVRHWLGGIGLYLRNSGHWALTSLRRFSCAFALLVTFWRHSQDSITLAEAIPPGDARVTLVEREKVATLSNGLVTAAVNESNGRLLSLKSGDLELLGTGGAYWDGVGATTGAVNRWGKDAAFQIVTKPEDQGGEIAEIATRMNYDRGPGVIPLNVDIHYILRRGEPGLRVLAVFEHDDNFPALKLDEGRMVLKVNPLVFDFLSVDEKRQRQMPTGEDWDRGTPLNLKEARRLTTGIHAGEVEHKYDYSAPLAETKTWGWSSTHEHVGLWVINPRSEYLRAGPAHIDLTGHLDVNRGGAPVLLNMWQSMHYGGRPIYLAEHELWRKEIGPFLLYVNHGGDPAELWRNACGRADLDRATLPDDWRGRGAVRGRLLIRDPQSPGASAAGAWVGLTAPPYTVEAPKENPRTFDWQLDGKYYQYWVRADAEGRFQIPYARPGTYMLNAFVDGVLGEFHRADVQVGVGEAVDLSDLEWTPERLGRQLWQIGVPNRSAEEFRHGDDYWHWGLYLKYPEEFPNDVKYIVGKSDWRRDWNYCQPPRIGPDGKVESTTWTIQFDLPQALRGTATLRLGIAGSRAPHGIEVTVNGAPAGSTGPLPDTGVMHRDGIRGAWFEERVPFDAGLLHAGTNTIGLHVPAKSWVEGVLYDVVRLEVTEK